MDSHDVRLCPICSYPTSLHEVYNHVVFHWLLPAPFQESQFADLEVEVGAARYVITTVDDEWSASDVEGWLQDELNAPVRLAFLMPSDADGLKLWCDEFLAEFDLHLSELRLFYYPVAQLV